jgi:2-polyprenyl-6-methoxyphenol hydroxylase-like FAD-dependent oxidoreductase
MTGSSFPAVSYPVLLPSRRRVPGHLGSLSDSSDPGTAASIFHGSLAPGTLPGPIRERLAEFAAANWPSPWREALDLTLRTGTVFGTPLVHYQARRLARGRASLAGDAAHAASPMVGGVSGRGCTTWPRWPRSRPR